MGLRTTPPFEYEVEVMRRLHGKAFVRDTGFLAADTVCGLLRRFRAGHVESGLAHCPLMNAVRGHIAPVVEYCSRGIPVTLAIDNMFADHFEVLRACVNVARIRTGDATVMQSPEVLRLATIEGAKALGMGAEIGSIEPGKRADLQMLDYRRFGLTPNLDPVRNLGAREGSLVMVDGRILVSSISGGRGIVMMRRRRRRPLGAVSSRSTAIS